MTMPDSEALRALLPVVEQAGERLEDETKQALVFALGINAALGSKMAPRNIDTSLDAADALVRELYPDAHVIYARGQGANACVIAVYTDEGRTMEEIGECQSAPTLCLAILIALIKAVISEEETKP